MRLQLWEMTRTIFNYFTLLGGKNAALCIMHFLGPRQEEIQIREATVEKNLKKKIVSSFLEPLAASQGLSRQKATHLLFSRPRENAQLRTLAATADSLRHSRTTEGTKGCVLSAK